MKAELQSLTGNLDEKQSLVEELTAALKEKENSVQNEPKSEENSQ